MIDMGNRGNIDVAPNKVKAMIKARPVLKRAVAYLRRSTDRQDQSVEDLLGLLDHLGIEKAHLAGLSMGGNVVLNFGL